MTDLPSIKTNFILNVVRLFLGSIFIVISTPYVTRAIGVEALGSVELVNTIISYIILFTSLGIPTYGIIAIAQVRKQSNERSQIFFELLVIQIITTICGYIVLYFLSKNLQMIIHLRPMVFAMSFGVILNNLGVEWLYQGMENQKYITIKYIITRCVALILIFTLIRNEKDYIKYGIILIMMNGGANIINLCSINRYVNFCDINIRHFSALRHIKPILVMFIATISVSIYIQIDIFMLGYVGDKYVGLYAISNKLVRLVNSLTKALGVILLPRISYYNKINDYVNYKKYMAISWKYILFLTLPSFVFVLLLANEIIIVMAGKTYIEAITTIKILSIIIPIIGVAYFMGFQILYPLGKERFYTYAVTCAAIVNVVFNYLMIPKYFHNGAAAGTVIAELIGMLLLVYFSRLYLPKLGIMRSENLKYLVASLCMATIILLLKSLKLRIYLTLMLSFFLGGLIYFFSLLFLNEELSSAIMKYLRALKYCNSKGEK
jgi:O-antigen/teichoic acid export membrane protein